MKSAGKRSKSLKVNVLHNVCVDMDKRIWTDQASDRQFPKQCVTTKVSMYEVRTKLSENNLQWSRKHARFFWIKPFFGHGIGPRASGMNTKHKKGTIMRAPRLSQLARECSAMTLEFLTNMVAVGSSPALDGFLYGREQKVCSFWQIV